MATAQLIIRRVFISLVKYMKKKGETKLAIENYEKLLNLWKDANQDLVDLVDAKARLAELKGMTKK